jgi:hypothetical protein
LQASAEVCHAGGAVGIAGAAVSMPQGSSCTPSGPAVSDLTQGPGAHDVAETGLLLVQTPSAQAAGGSNDHVVPPPGLQAAELAVKVVGSEQVPVGGSHEHAPHDAGGATRLAKSGGEAIGASAGQEGKGVPEGADHK